ncbi:PilZ domain-containing protein [Methylomonas sp. EFPC3]|uniref:PilZ domain-containing protein n=1 Tax=unclassified Methylomonas TaxID=2608980 RepID=UPI00241652E2|nr:PilZ domain-containing protein [Methylomonas sp. EFPC3]WFP50888.1 PilZ domain-containing protein [Methylomonas sp. EFPC3]
MIDNKRRHPRLKHRAKIKLIVPESVENIVEMRDFSETGLFLQCDKALIPPIGTVLEVQTTEFDDAPVQLVRVVRIDPDSGFAVEFCSRD